MTFAEGRPEESDQLPEEGPAGQVPDDDRSGRQQGPDTESGGTGEAPGQQDEESGGPGQATGNPHSAG